MCVAHNYTVRTHKKHLDSSLRVHSVLRKAPQPKQWHHTLALQHYVCVCVCVCVNAHVASHIAWEQV